MVVKECNLTGGQARVYHCLAEHDQGKGEGAWPSVPTIMKETSLCRATVFYALQHLSERGLIERNGMVPVDGALGAATVRYQVNYNQHLYTGGPPE